LIYVAERRLTIAQPFKAGDRKLTMRADDSVVADATELNLCWLSRSLKSLCPKSVARENKQPPYAEGVL
jgi:hypothetical protein